MPLLALFALLAAVALWASSARAADAIEVQSARVEPAAADEGWALSADFSVSLPEGLVEAVSRGVALHFVIEFEATRPRWYWRDERISQLSQIWRLSYHALTRQYRLSRDGYTQAFETLEAALAAMSRLRGWQVIEREQLRAGVDYDLALRMRLDLSMLPKPFQVTAITNRDWTLPAEWKRWKLTP